ncbi:MAG: murein transglycosylase A [Citrobacter freundii]|nr:murein transglycosylase A [Citrobacter freundii]
MKGRWAKYLLAGAVVAMLAACSSKPTDRGQQYKDGKFTQPFSLVNQPDAVGAPINAGDFAEQVNQIRSASPRLYGNQSNVYNAIQQWLRAGGDTRSMRQFGIDAWQMEGTDNYGNVQFTGYYTPVIQARHTRQGEFQYPIYRMPPKRGRLPSRAEIYAGALSDNYILAYSNSLMDNFIMDVQGSGYIDFGDGSPLNFFSYSGKNGHAYRSIGKVLIDRGEVKKEDMSMQAIRHWGETHSEAEVRELASDRSIIPAGTTLLAEVPLLDNNGKFTGQYELRLMVALDVGGAIKGQHFDIYQGIGADAGHRAGWYNHYGRVWVLKTAPGAGNVFSG